MDFVQASLLLTNWEGKWTLAVNAKVLGQPAGWKEVHSTGDSFPIKTFVIRDKDLSLEKKGVSVMQRVKHYSMHTHTHACTQHTCPHNTCAHTCTHMHHTYMHMSIEYTCTQAHSYTDAYRHAHICTQCTRTHVCVHRHAHNKQYTCTHTHTTHRIHMQRMYRCAQMHTCKHTGTSTPFFPLFLKDAFFEHIGEEKSFSFCPWFHGQSCESNW